jgi:hypothetical protein
MSRPKIAVQEEKALLCVNRKQLYFESICLGAQGVPVAGGCDLVDAG